TQSSVESTKIVTGEVVFFASQAVVAENPSVNVAFKNRPAAEGRWVEQLTDGDPLRPFAPWPIEFPYYYVNLVAVVNQPFDVHTYGEYVTPSYFTHCYHWDVLAKPKGEVINLHLTKLVQLIRIGRKNPNPPAPVSPILMSEAEAFGTLLLE
ncbi:hypothetical protein X801_05924, partial [Opisthorchis viverrini]